MTSSLCKETKYKHKNIFYHSEDFSGHIRHPAREDDLFDRVIIFTIHVQFNINSHGCDPNQSRT